MAEIIPFRALRYDAARLPIEKLVTQPYDKITPPMQQRYYQASPYNLVRIILGRAEPGDTGQDDIYRRSAAFFRDWQRDKILVPDLQPSIYVYAQRFSPPGANSSGATLNRVGFIALGKLHDYSEGVVFRHEQTLSQPKADRLALLRATRAHFGQIFMLYSDPGQELDSLLHPAGPPDVSLSDEYGVQHSLWRCSDPGWIEQVRRKMADQKLLIADGHHRYETALAYRDERRRSEPAPSKASPKDYDYVMMTFINMDSPGVLILPTHRVLRGMAEFDEAVFFRDLARHFRVEAVSESSAPELLEHLKRAGEDGPALLAVTAAGARLLRSIPAASANNRDDELDVVKLHRLVLEGALKMSEESIRQQKNISYIRDAAEAIQAVRSGEAQIAFLMNPVRIAQLRRIAFAGNVMPQKSTDFYPKLLSGLTIYALQ